MEKDLISLANLFGEKDVESYADLLVRNCKKESSQAFTIRITKKGTILTNVLDVELPDSTDSSI